MTFLISYVFIHVQLASIPGLEDVTVSTPAPAQPAGGAAAAPAAAGSGPPPPAADIPQTAAEVHVLDTHGLFFCLSS